MSRLEFLPHFSQKSCKTSAKTQKEINEEFKLVLGKKGCDFFGDRLINFCPTSIQLIYLFDFVCVSSDNKRVTKFNF